MAGLVRLAVVAILIACSPVAICQSPDEIGLKTVSGHVVDQTGAALPGAEVSLICKAHFGAPEIATARTRSAAAGQFALHSPQGDYILDIREPGFLEMRLPLTLEGEASGVGGIQVTLKADQTLSCGPCVSPIDEKPLQSVSGYVTDQTGARIPGAEVSLQSNHAVDAVPAPMRVQSDGEGRFILQERPGEYTLDILKGGFSPWRMTPLRLENAPLPLGKIELATSECSPCLTQEQDLPFIDVDLPKLTALIEPVPMPEYNQPARRFREHR